MLFQSLYFTISSIRDLSFRGDDINPRKEKLLLSVGVPLGEPAAQPTEGLGKSITRYGENLYSKIECFLPTKFLRFFNKTIDKCK